MTDSIFSIQNPSTFNSSTFSPQTSKMNITRDITASYTDTLQGDWGYELNGRIVKCQVGEEFILGRHKGGMLAPWKWHCQALRNMCQLSFDDVESLQVHFEQHFSFARIQIPLRSECRTCRRPTAIRTATCTTMYCLGPVETYIVGRYLGPASDLRFNDDYWPALMLLQQRQSFEMPPTSDSDLGLLPTHDSMTLSEPTPTRPNDSNILPSPSTFYPDGNLPTIPGSDIHNPINIDIDSE
jgi:hypothetical protein